jgi:transcription antitermination factor NusA-like protein
MTDQEKNLLVDFRLKMKQIISRHEMLKLENKQLLEKIENLEKTVQQLHQENNLAEQKYKTLKLSKLFDASDDDKKDAKNRIQKLVREIDKCIALLNK